MAAFLRNFSSSSSKLVLGAAAAAAAAAAAGYALSRTSAKAHCAAAAAAKRLDPGAFVSFALRSKEKLTHDTYLLKFEHDASVTYAEAMPAASCLLARLPTGSKKEDGSPAFFLRPYTPTNLPSDRGVIDLVVKDYPGGKMSSAICALKPGQTMEMKGPIPKVAVSTNKWKRVGMVCGGTGITPMYQVLLASLSDRADTTSFSLVYGSRSSDDIILKAELDALAEKHRGRLDITYLVDKAPLPPPSSNAAGSSTSSKTGYVDAALLKKALPKPSADSIVMVCGPPPMMVAVSGPKAKDKTQGEVEGLLKELGYKSDNVFKF